MNINTSPVYSICFFFFLTSNLFSQKLYVSKNVDFADQLIEKGATNTAYFILKKELKNKNYSILDKYKITKLISRCFLKEMDMYHYDEYNTKAFELVKDKEEIYKAQYYAERVYFFHDLTWADSVMYYALRARAIFDQNKKDWSKIEVPFMYRMFGVSYLYNNLEKDIKIKKWFGMPKPRVKMLNLIDSSIILTKKHPYRHLSDLALAYKGRGNRYLDMVSGYRYPTKNRPYTISKLGWFAFYKAVSSYRESYKLLANENIPERISIYSLLGLSYMCIGKPQIAKLYFDTMNTIYESKYKSHILTPKMYLNCLTYERINDFNLPYNSVKNQNAIKKISRILPQWNQYLNSHSKYSYDTYTISPYSQLFSYYARKFMHSRKQIDAFKAVQFLLTEKYHFLLFEHSNQNELSKWEMVNNEITFLDEIDKKNVYQILKIIKPNKSETKYKLIDFKSIQNRLLGNEAMIINYHSKIFTNNFIIVVSHNKIYFVNENIFVDKHKLHPEFDKMTFEEYKKWAFKHYYLKFYKIAKLLPDVNQFYTLYDDDVNYDIMITRNKGKDFSHLPFAIIKYKFLKIYNLKTFFNTPLKGKRNLDLIMLPSSNLNKLPFMQSFNPRKYLNCKLNKYSNSRILSKNIIQNGILHVVGHGNLVAVDSFTQSKHNKIIIKNSNFETVRFDSVKRIKKELVILNNCFSGFRTGYLIEYDHSLYLDLMRKGTLSLIASKDKVDDYVSSQIMKYFYIYLNKGIPVGEALIYAKRKFLRENKNGYANPVYWSPFFAISSRKVKF